MMETTPRGNDPAPTSVEEDPLPRPQRVIAGVVGFAAAGAGAVATFMHGTNTGGVPLLIGSGAVFAYLAITGQRLTRLEAGGAKAELARTRRVIETVLVDPKVAEDTKVEIAEVVEEEEVPLRRPARRVVDAVLDSRNEALRYKAAVHQAIYRVRPDLMVTMAPPEMHADMLLLHRGAIIPVEVKWLRYGSGGAAAMQRLGGQLLSDDGPRLLITNESLQIPRELRTVLAGKLKTVTWPGPEADDHLKAALDALAPSESPPVA